MSENNSNEMNDIFGYIILLTQTPIGQASTAVNRDLFNIKRGIKFIGFLPISGQAKRALLEMLDIHSLNRNHRWNSIIPRIYNSHINGRLHYTVCDEYVAEEYKEVSPTSTKDLITHVQEGVYVEIPSDLISRLPTLYRDFITSEMLQFKKNNFRKKYKDLIISSKNLSLIETYKKCLWFLDREEEYKQCKLNNEIDSAIGQELDKVFEREVRQDPIVSIPLGNQPNLYNSSLLSSIYNISKYPNFISNVNTIFIVIKNNVEKHGFRLNGKKHRSILWIKEFLDKNTDFPEKDLYSLCFNTLRDIYETQEV